MSVFIESAAVRDKQLLAALKIKDKTTIRARMALKTRLIRRSCLASVVAAYYSILEWVLNRRIGLTSATVGFSLDSYPICFNVFL